MNNREELLAEIARLNEELANIREAAATVVNSFNEDALEGYEVRELESVIPSDLLD